MSLPNKTEAMECRKFLTKLIKYHLKQSQAAQGDFVRGKHFRSYEMAKMSRRVMRAYIESFPK